MALTNQSEIIGGSKKMEEVRNLIKKYANSDSTVLILGETGTGKELVARALHSESQRCNELFLSKNMAAIPSELVESELFGSDKGSHSKANELTKGLFETAGNGTVFLDEIGSTDLKVQAKLLRVLAEREFTRVGGQKPIKLAARVVAATNKPLSQKIDDGAFRDDLFYRLHQLSIKLPTLRERRDDIPELIQHFLKCCASDNSKKLTVTPAAMEYLCAFDWPGNVRQLKDEIERLCKTCETEEIKETDLFPEITKSAENVLATWEKRLPQHLKDFLRKNAMSLNAKKWRRLKIFHDCECDGSRMARALGKGVPGGEQNRSAWSQYLKQNKTLKALTEQIHEVLLSSDPAEANPVPTGSDIPQLRAGPARSKTNAPIMVIVVILSVCLVACGVALSQALDWYKLRHPVYSLKIVFSPVTSGEEQTSGPEAWIRLQTDIETTLRKNLPFYQIRRGFVSPKIFPNNDQQLNALKGKDVHIFTLSAGAVANAVLDPSYRYRPVFELCNSSNRPLHYHAIFIINTNYGGITNVDALISALQQTNSRMRFGYGQTTSHSSYRIPFLVFNKAYYKDSERVPNDKLIYTGLTQGELIDKVESNGIAAACVADDAFIQSNSTNQCNTFSLPTDRLDAVGLDFLTNNSFPSVSFGWSQDLPMPLQLCFEDAFMKHPWTNDPDFKKAYAKLYPSVTGVTASKFFWENTNWGSVLDAKRMVDALNAKH